MLELPMTTPRYCEKPAVRFEELDDLAHLQLSDGAGASDLPISADRS